MVATYQPDSPTIQGVEWPVTRKGGSVVDGRHAAAARIVPTATQTVTHVSAYVDRVIGEGVYQLDVWKESDLPQTVQQATFRPNEDKHPGGWAITGGGANRYAVVDESVLDTADYVAQEPEDTPGTGAPPKPSGSYVAFGMNSAAGLAAGTQVVLSVEVHAVVGLVLAATPSLIGVNIYGVMNDRPHADAVFLTPAMGATPMSWTFETNPTTGAAWTEQDIVDLDDTAKSTAFAGIDQFSPNGDGIATDEVRLYQLYIVVNYINDTSLSTAQLTINADGWQSFDVADFTKTSAQNLVCILRRMSGSGQLVVPSLDSGATAPSSPGAYRLSFGAAGNVSALGDVLTESHGIQFRVAGAASIDSQPYVDVVRSPVDAAHTVQQEFTAASTASRQWVKVVAGSSRHQKPAADLTVKIRASSGGAQVGGTGTITPAMVADAPYPLQEIVAILASAAALTNGTQYYVELTSTAAAGNGWDIAILDAKAPPVSGYTAGFGGGTDRATVGGVEYNDLDVLAVVGIVPTSPTGMAAVGAATNVALSWNATALGGSFSRYYLERLGSDGTSWQRIAEITTEATHTYTDKQARMGVAETYRVSVKHTNGTVSAPSSTASATATAAATYLLVSETTAVQVPVTIAAPTSIKFPRDAAWSNRMGKRFRVRTRLPYDRGLRIGDTIHLKNAGTGLASQLDALRGYLDGTERWALLTTTGERYWVALDAEEASRVASTYTTVPATFTQIDDRPAVVVV